MLGLVRDGEVVAEWRVATVESRTADEWSVLIRGLLGDLEEQVERDRGLRDGARRCCRSGGPCSPTTSAACRSVVVEPGVRTGVPVLTDNPREVGTDRIVNALAAATRYGGPAVVVDFGGTATTFDVVNPQGQYIGGAISPGIEISLEALERRGAQLRMVELRRPRSVIARNTVEALQSGMVFGVASQVDGIVARMIDRARASSRPTVSVVATGYLAPLVVGRVPAVSPPTTRGSRCAGSSWSTHVTR